MAIGFRTATIGSGNTVSSVTVNKPTSTAVGETMVVELSANAAKTWNVPTGWTIMPGTTAGTETVALYRIADSSDTSVSSYSFTITSGTANLRAGLNTITGIHTTNPWDGNASFNQPAAGTSNAIPGVTVTTGTWLLSWAFRVGSAATLTCPGTMTQDFQDNTNQSFAGAHEAASAGSTGTRTWTWVGTSVVGGLLVSVNAPSTDVTITGVVATVASAAPAGTVSVTQNPTVAGPVATVASAAPAGAVSTQQSVAVAGALGTVASAAPAGTVAATQSPTVAGPVATVASAALAGSVSTGTDVAVAGPVATVASGAPAGSVVAIDNVTISGPVSTVAVAALAGAVRIDAILPAPTATIASAAIAGTATVTANPTITGPVAPVSATAPAGGVSTQNSATIPGAVALATSTALVGMIAITANPTIVAPIANTTTAALAGTVVAVRVVTIAGPVAAVSIVALPPTTPAPDERTCTLAAASRVYAAPALLRTCTVPAAPRTVEVT